MNRYRIGLKELEEMLNENNIHAHAETFRMAEEKLESGWVVLIENNLP